MYIFGHLGTAFSSPVENNIKLKTVTGSILKIYNFFTPSFDKKKNFAH